MAHTYSTPESRAQARPRSPAAPARIELLLLIAASLVLVAAMWSVGSAKATAIADAASRASAGTLVNLNTVTTTDALLPHLTVFPDARERQFVAREVLDHVSGGGTGPTSRRVLPNIGALARLAAESRRVRATAGLTTLQGRLRDARERAGGSEPERLALFTPSQLAAIKPSLTVRTPADVRSIVRWHVVLVIGAFLLAHGVRRWHSSISDPYLLPTLLALSAIGMVMMVSLRDPLRDVMLLAPFAQGVAAGALALLAVTFLDLERSVLPRLSYVPLVAALALSLLLVSIGSGPGGSDARVNLFGVQPVDVIRLLVTLFLAGYFARRWEVLRELEDTGREMGGWWRALRPPRHQDLVPVVGGVAVVLVAFFLQKDLGPALMVACVFLGMYGVARGRWAIALGGLALLMGGFVAGYVLRISSTLIARIQIWQSPWDNGARGGDQVAQALWALASGGWMGAGLGQGMPQIIPAAHTDLVLAAIGEELGFAGILAIAILYAVLVGRGFNAARRAPGEYSSLLATGLTLGLVLPVLLIAGGLLGIVPLTGVVTPFLSYGRSALVANFVAVGLLLSIASRATRADEPSPFAPGITRLAIACAALALVLVGVAARTQTWNADEVVAAGALTRQADGQRRYSYNPRLLAMADLMVRGTIYDRRGVALATSDPTVVTAGAAAFKEMGLQVPADCASDGRRCYPFGGPLFHVLGDVETQVNWAASNTSLVERDRDARLRGYDDQARSVEVVDPADDGRSRAVRRNLKVLLPLWKHRDDLTHPEAQALLAQPRDLRITIDARLQRRVANLLRERLAAARLRRGAVVVIDASTGALLASVSYPWPDAAGSGPRPAAPTPEDAAERLLDRARYGAYPPGSTFKLVTAAAVLRSAPALADAPLLCRRLDDGRVGNVVRGWRRPVRDDVGDTVPHGDVTLDRGIVQSCNAYFAQLGVELGAARLAESAALFDIRVARGNTPERLRDTLPFAAYGQGEVVATPFRMARVAAAIAADGVLQPPRLFIDTAAAADTQAVRVLDEASARRLANAMRQVVVAGTGRGLMAHPELVAGKTGTAEIEGAPSHSWFIGFAPHASTSKRIAFAVILENGGYGGRAAAPLAGDVVTAARELGLLGEARTIVDAGKH